MCKFNLNGVDYKLYFRHKKYNSQMITECWATVIAPDGLEDPLKRIVEDTKGEKVTVYLVGTAYCNPKDNFCRKVGRRIALTRLISQMRLVKEDRQKIWDTYFLTHKK